MVAIRALQRDDRPSISRILHDTGNFTAAEIAVALELIDIYLNQPQQRDYLLYCATDTTAEVIGYVCFGPTPMTEGTWDLYWIAVAPQHQGRGVGRELMEFVENYVSGCNGRQLFIETSSQPKYEPTRRFYLRRNYQEIARIPDFYSVGDDRVIYRKLLR
ncbi:MAG: GNAT family N-acetyltransferase [candidate division KSB1 bacterium]|nr:GNAT family N-acetyltransferase [candidate division KSB1 bacterium]MDZ7272668.1 GNAT family N-acetyltransferase [candidate division KSB1 bacterium]MDZ7284310.1 GNAT family N-acetyltransferase [candidate division KSB1 bacterium]MDZ7297294.1 GNAT family N-acetyltransferase [candidate division KSB1 bacterium]MDZ7309032.1 GNAT family N-acetyltransferase [candidate division KSB1 bacterium]